MTAVFSPCGRAAILHAEASAVRAESRQIRRHVGLRSAVRALDRLELELEAIEGELELWDGFVPWAADLAERIDAAESRLHSLETRLRALRLTVR